MKLIELTLSPKTTFDPVPETIHEESMVGVALFLIMKLWFAAVKLIGLVPDPSGLEPQVESAFRFPVALEKYAAGPVIVILNVPPAPA